MKNRKGFTLVELLAVIVVLAIIMIIALPSVLTAMDNAKKSSFVVEARKILNQAMSQVQSDELSGQTIKSCYSLSDLGIEGGGKYKGSVSVSGTTYTIYLFDGNYAVQGKSSGDLNTDSNITTTTTEPANIATCGSAS